MSTFTTVADKSKLPPGQAIEIQVGGKSIAVFNAGGAYYAVDAECTHVGGPLAEGEIEGTVVTCPWHGATFDLKNGRVCSAPAGEDIACYAVRVSGNDVQVEIP